MSRENVELARAMHEAFNRGDTDFVADQLDADLEWEEGALPARDLPGSRSTQYLGTSVGAGVFAKLAADATARLVSMMTATMIAVPIADTAQMKRLTEFAADRWLDNVRAQRRRAPAIARPDVGSGGP